MLSSVLCGTRYLLTHDDSCFYPATKSHQVLYTYDIIGKDDRQNVRKTSDGNVRRLLLLSVVCFSHILTHRQTITPRTDNRFLLHDQLIDISGQIYSRRCTNMLYIGHVAWWEPCNLHDVAHHIFPEFSVLHRSCTASHNCSLGYIYSYFSSR